MAPNLVNADSSKPSLRYYFSHCISLVVIRLLLLCGRSLLDGYNNGLASLVKDSLLLLLFFCFVFGIDVFALLILLLIVVTDFCAYFLC